MPFRGQTVGGRVPDTPDRLELPEGERLSRLRPASEANTL